MQPLIISKENFDAEVMNSEKPVLLDFWAPWCGPCRMIGPIIDEIAKEVDSVKVGKINVDNDPELAEAFGAASIPLLVLVKGREVVDHILGAVPKETIMALIKPYTE
ncbi:MAG: thioredoxin [Defluviitaleaceae bacterium]|nr:thioredoxin [Defluviitaleaceae bacterium]